MNRLRELLGKEHALDYVSRSLRDFAQQQRAAVVGALHVTCSDECEREAVESFQHWFVENLLPDLKFWSKSPFRTANLGGRYEWGAIRIAEQHFATPVTCDDFKLLVVKINAHVAVTENGGSYRYGRMNRYDTESAFCGAIHALLDDQRQPAIDELREMFAGEGLPRLEILRDPQHVDPELKSLLAAVTSARLQARRAMVDIQDYQPTTPTLYLVIPCVTLNREQRDTELIVGMYTADRRRGQDTDEYQGLGSDPGKYEVHHRHNLLHVEDEQLHEPRASRDHRQEILKLWQERRASDHVKDKRLAEFAEQTRAKKHDNVKFSKEMLKTLLWILLEIAPVSTSLLLFANGIAGIHHLYRVYRVALGQQDKSGAEAIVHEYISRVDSLPPEEAKTVIDMLVQHHGLDKTQPMFAR